MSHKARLKRIEGCLPYPLHLHRLYQRLLMLTGNARTQFCHGLSHAEHLGVLKLDLLLLARAHGETAVRKMLEETGEYHPDWIDWLMNGNLDQAELTRAAAYLTEEEEEAE